MKSNSKGDQESGIATEDQEEQEAPSMASIGRSFKPPPNYFPRARRPPMSGRTVTNSSDASEVSTSSRSDDHSDLLMSGLNTPAQEKSDLDASNAPASPEARSPRDETSSVQSTAYYRSHPIAIQLPTTSLRKIKSAPACTPPEPLSARGDVLGGYFPFHEDPKGRVHRPHPFHADPGQVRHQSINLMVETSQAVHRGASHSTIMASPSTHLSPLTALEADKLPSSTPVTSYLPSGVHNVNLPMGKYYPSNYERRNTQEPLLGTSAPPSRTSNRFEGHAHTREGFRSSKQDSEVRRKLQQYQRDMIAQARLAASEVLGSSVRQVSAASTSTITLNGVPLTNMHQVGTTSIHKPTSPRLLPLGSPGPVTPMNLEGEDGGYLGRARDEEISLALRAEEARIRREGATSPAVETGPQAF